MKKTQLPFDGKEDYEDIFVKYRKQNDAEIAELKGRLELKIAEAGDKFIDSFPSSLIVFFPADDLKAAAIGVRYCFQLGIYGLRCAREEYNRIYHDFKKDHWDKPDMSILKEEHKQ